MPTFRAPKAATAHTTPKPPKAGPRIGPVKAKTATKLKTFKGAPAKHPVKVAHAKKVAHAAKAMHARKPAGKAHAKKAVAPVRKHP